MGVFYTSGGVDGNAGAGLKSQGRARSGSVTFPLTQALSPSEGEGDQIHERVTPGGARCPASAKLRRGTSLTRGYFLKPVRGC